MDRKDFLKISLVGLAGLGTASTEMLFAQKPVTPPQLLPETVKEFVGKSHFDLDRVREMLGNEPNLLNASWDLGGGDFETGLGAAGHVGNTDIARFLLDQGARADIFVLTMLGHTALVQALLDAYPSLLRSLGPHGFTLLHHAQKGDEPAKPLYDFLLSKGLTETRVDIYKK